MKARDWLGDVSTMTYFVSEWDVKPQLSQFWLF